MKLSLPVLIVLIFAACDPSRGVSPVLPGNPTIGVMSAPGVDELAERFESPIFFGSEVNAGFGVGAATATGNGGDPYARILVECRSVMDGSSPLAIQPGDSAFGEPIGSALLDDPPDAMWIHCATASLGPLDDETLATCEAGFQLLAPASSGRTFDSDHAVRGEVSEFGERVEGRVTFVGALEDTLDENPDALEGNAIEVELWFLAERCS